MATLYKTTGEIVEVKPEGKTFTLAELQKLVGGYIELVHTHDGKDMYINEEGKLQMKHAFNLRATELYANNHVDVIVGDAVVCEYDEIDHG